MELWVSDGSSAGTKMVKDIKGGSGSGLATPDGIDGGSLLVVGNTAERVLHHGDGDVLVVAPRRI